jgi:hypothetical protein
VDRIDYSPVNITPGSIVTLTTTWSSIGFAPGDYSANATGYWGESNQTNSLITNFSIVSPVVPTPTPSPSPSPGGGGISPPGIGWGAPAATPGVPTTIPPSLKPRVGVVFFSRKTVLQEVLAGESALMTLTFKNVGSEAVSASMVFSGLPAGSQIAPQKFFLQPQASSSIDFGVWVPEDTVPGDYVVKVSVLENSTGEEVTTEYFFLRVKRYPSDYANPIVLRRVSLDLQANSTNVVLSVRNPSANAISVVDVIDAIPSPLAATQNDIVFLDKIGSYLSTEPLTLVWRLTNMEPQERSVITYDIKLLSDDYSVYGTWWTKQVATSPKVRLSDLVTITDFNIQSLTPGGTSKASFTAFYGGLAPLEITAFLVLSPGLKPHPQTISHVILPPHSAAQFEFEVTADEKIAVGSYAARAAVTAMNEEVSSISAVMILPSGFEGGLNYFLIIAVVITVVLATVIAWFVRRRRGKPFYDRERVNYATSLRKIIVEEGEEKR